MPQSSSESTVSTRQVLVITSCFISKDSKQRNAVMGGREGASGGGRRRRRRVAGGGGGRGGAGYEQQLINSDVNTVTIHDH